MELLNYSSSSILSISHAAIRHENLFRAQKQVVKMTTADFNINKAVSVNATTSNRNLNQVQRRSANYHPTIWHPNSIKTFNTPYTYEFYGTKLEELKQKVRRCIISSKEPLARLKLIDSVQRLGVAYHFDEEIEDSINDLLVHEDHDLYTAGLRFRLFRQQRYSISSDVFDKFKDKNGRFMENLSEDVAGLLSLYEASHLGISGEDDLEEARNFSIKHLTAALVAGKLNGGLGEQVKKSLEIPLHWRMQRLEARNFIEEFTVEDATTSVLLELAKLDYNLVQSVYQTDLKELSKWWRELGLNKKLSFSRDRLMENYLWAMGIVCEPQLSKCRQGLTKFICILTAIDDVYDVYGTLDELQMFNDAVNRWEIGAMEDLPEYMKLSYFAMFNLGNEIAYDLLKEHDFNTLRYIREEWGNLCGAYLREAKWFYGNYTPTLDEYIGNSWVSVGGPAAMLHAYLLLHFPITKPSLDSFKIDNKDAIYWSSLITRLSDDLGTSKDEMMRGDVAKSIQCHMSGEGVSEEEARDYIKGLICSAWKKLNEGLYSSRPKSELNLLVNMGRTAQCIFQHGDGIGTSTGPTKDRLVSLFLNPIPLSPLPP